MELAKRAISRAETLYGDLEPFQRERVERWVADSPFDFGVSFGERRHRQQDALRTLGQLSGEPPESARAQELINGWLRRFDPSPREAYRLYAERVVRHNCGLAADIHNSTSPAQRRAASKQLRDWAAELRALAAEAGT